MTAKTPYIKFELLEQKPKTQVFQVVNIHNGSILGIIKWYGQWRQYVFYPNADCLFSEGCMTDIINFMRNLMKKHRDAAIL